MVTVDDTASDALVSGFWEVYLCSGDSEPGLTCIKQFAQGRWRPRKSTHIIHFYKYCAESSKWIGNLYFLSLKTGTDFLTTICQLISVDYIKPVSSLHHKISFSINQRIVGVSQVLQCAEVHAEHEKSAKFWKSVRNNISSVPTPQRLPWRGRWRGGPFESGTTNFSRWLHKIDIETALAYFWFFVLVFFGIILIIIEKKNTSNHARPLPKKCARMRRHAQAVERRLTVLKISHEQ